MTPILRWRLFVRSLLLQAGFSEERRQALGFAWAIDPALARAYADSPAGLSAARARQLAAFNSQPCAAGLPLGVAAALEARAAAGDASAAARANALKASLGAALSGAADALFWGSLRPLAAASAVLGAIFALRLGARWPLAWGGGLGLLIFNVPAVWTRWAGLGLGLVGAESAAAKVCLLPAQNWIRAARRAAVLAIFAAVCAALYLKLGPSRPFAAAAFAAGAVLGAFAGGPLRLAAAAGIFGAAAAAATGWTP